MPKMLLSGFDNTYHELFRTYYPLIRAYAATLVGEQDADDVAEDVFTELWKHRDTIVAGQRLQGYLFRAAYTRSLNLLKHRKIASSHLQLIDDINEYREQYFDSHTANPQLLLERKELQQHINQAIANLPDKCRQVFRLSYLQGMTAQEIADALEISIRTVETHIYKALRQLRSVLKPQT